MNRTGKRILGLTFNGQPIWEPQSTASSLIFAATSGGKTTCVAVPTILSLLSDHSRGIVINDVKNGEIALQIGAMCLKYCRRFGVVYDMAVLGADYPHRLSLNPFGASLALHHKASGDLPFSLENQTHAMIEEPRDDAKNFYWRETPRQYLELGQRILLSHHARLATPGGLAALIGNPDTWHAALEIASEEGDAALKSLARQALEMRKTNPEHYSQHIQAAITALKIYAPGTPLHSAGCDADLTHEELIREKWVVCFVNPVRFADRMGTHFALHTLALMEAQLSGRAGKADYILDEYCNAPLRTLINRITVYRAFGARAHFITQSRSDSVRKYGEKETALLEENCTVKQWLKFSNFEEAERVSRAMGEQQVISPSLSLNSGRVDSSGSIATGRQRIFSASELMMLPGDEQIIHIADIGFIHCKKIRQNQIAPYCHELADNPLEGGRLPPDPKITLDPTPR